MQVHPVHHAHRPGIWRQQHQHGTGGPAATRRHPALQRAEPAGGFGGVGVLLRGDAAWRWIFQKGKCLFRGLLHAEFAAWVRRPQCSSSPNGTVHLLAFTCFVDSPWHNTNQCHRAVGSLPLALLRTSFSFAGAVWAPVAPVWQHHGARGDTRLGEFWSRARLWHSLSSQAGAGFSHLTVS